jgi:hypothetical protein
MISGNRSSGSNQNHRGRDTEKAAIDLDGGLFCASVVLWQLVAGNLKLPFLITNSPGAGDELVVRADIL